MLRFDVELIGEAVLERAFDDAANAASRGLAHAVREGIQVGAEHARRHHTYQDRTGKLTASIRAEMVWQSPVAAVGKIMAAKGYAQHVERGTRPHVIEARRRKALHWEDGGVDRFARRVQHPGTEARPFIEPAGEVAAKHIERSIELDILLNVERVLAIAS